MYIDYNGISYCQPSKMDRMFSPDSSECRLTHEIGDHISRDRIVSLTDAVLAIGYDSVSIGDCCAGDISFRSCN